MDKLEKALEKAKAEKKLKIAQTKIKQEKTYRLQDFDYIQTKQHELDLEELRQRRIVSLQKFSPEAGVFKMLRTKILLKLRENYWNSFGITAPTQGAGKSMVAVNLAIAMAMEANQTVMLVDLDLKYPKIHWYFDMKIKAGLIDYLQSDLPLADFLVNPGIDRLVLLPGRGQILESSEIISGPKMRTLVEDIKSRYQSRIIIFDLPPVLAVDDVLASMDYYDAALLVVEEGQSKPDDIKKALQMLSRTNLLGTVLNKSEHPSEHYGYY